MACDLVTVSSLFLRCVIIAITVYIHAANCCPSQCSCTYQANSQLAVVCSTTDVSSIPHNIDPQTQLLTITGQRNVPFSLSHLSKTDFQSLTHLQHLTVSFTHLTSIEEDSLLDVVHLKRIDLANNKLSELLPNTFITLRNLTFVSLSNNPGLAISDRAFWHLQSLQELYLSGLGMTELRPGMFYGLKSLRQLDVSSNKLTSFSPDVMLQVPNLWSLDLAFNELMSLDPLLEPYFLHLKRVQLGGNRWQCNCLVRWMKSYPKFIAPRSSDPVICSAPAGLEYVSLVDIDTQQLVCEPPVIHNCPASVRVYVGESLIIRCMVTGDPYPTITWTFADGTRMTSGSYPGMPIKDRAAIEVHNVPMSHNGNLTLTATNRDGTVSTEINVIVTTHTSPTTTTTTTMTTSTTSSTSSTTTTPTTFTTTPTSTAEPTTTTATTTTTASSPSTTETTVVSTKLPSLWQISTSTKTSPSPSTSTTPKSSTPKSSHSSTSVAITRATKSSRKSGESDSNSPDNTKPITLEPKEDVDIAPIIIASVASTSSLMMAAGIAVYFLKKNAKYKQRFKSKVAPHTPESMGAETSEASAKDLTHHVLRMQKFEAPARPSTLYQ